MPQQIHDSNDAKLAAHLELGKIHPQLAGYDLIHKSPRAKDRRHKF